MNNRKLCVGWAQRSITPNGPILMEGQMYPRVSRYVHDPITATALALDNGKQQAIFFRLCDSINILPVQSYTSIHIVGDGSPVSQYPPCHPEQA